MQEVSKVEIIEKQLNNLEKNITPLLKKVGGVCLVTDAKWVNH